MDMMDSMTVAFLSLLCLAAPFVIIWFIVRYIEGESQPPIIAMRTGTRSGKSHDFIDSAMFLSLEDD